MPDNNRRIILVQMDADTGHILGTQAGEDAWHRVRLRVLHKQKRGKDYSCNCPHCGMLLHSFYNADYCGLCGQAVTWYAD